MGICELNSVHKIYSSEAGEVHALQDISCSITRGEFVVVAGPSGSGKTSLVNILGFLDRASSGEYQFMDKNISPLHDDEYTLLRREYVGFIFQSFNLMSTLNVVENVAMACELKGDPPALANEKALEILSQVGMGEYARRYPKQLSSGQQQRVAIARALIKEPALLIADEPTASLDSKNTMDIIELMFELNKKNNCICVLCTHDERVIKMAPRLLYIDDGRITKDRHNS